MLFFLYKKHPIVFVSPLQFKNSEDFQILNFHLLKGIRISIIWEEIIW